MNSRPPEPSDISPDAQSILDLYRGQPAGCCIDWPSINDATRIMPHEPRGEAIRELLELEYMIERDMSLELTEKGAQYLAQRPTDMEERYRQLADRVTELERHLVHRVTELERRLDAMIAAGR
jgi:hypothetical protein